MPGRPPLRLVLAALLALAATGCTSSPEPAPRPTGPVALPSPAADVDPSVTAACGRLLAALPDEIDPGVTRRPVTDDAGRFAAWGEPPVLLECGAAVGDPADQPAGVNGVMWAVRDIGAGFRWSTTELGINVAVDVPDGYSGAELVNPLAAPITAVLPQTPSPAPGG